MPGERVQGLADAMATLGALPDGVTEQIGVELAIIGRDFLALQQVRAPVLTGALEAGLGIQLLLDRLRVRIGLNSLTAGRADLFYGRIIEFGRHAQTVLVQRRRRVNGLLRVARGRKRAEDIATTYALHVKAESPEPFVLVDDADVDALATQRLADFWAQLMARIGATA